MKDKIKHIFSLIGMFLGLGIVIGLVIIFENQNHDNYSDNSNDDLTPSSHHSFKIQRVVYGDSVHLISIEIDTFLEYPIHKKPKKEIQSK